MGFDLAGAALIVFLAAAVQGLSGFGFALLAAPALTFVLPVRDSVVLVTALALAVSARQTVQLRHSVNRGVARRLSLASLAGMPVGLFVFLNAPESMLRSGVGAATVVSAALLLWKPAARIESRSLDVVAGFVSGALKTSVSTNGPPLVTALQLRRLPTTEFRATVSAVLAVGNGVGLALFLLSGSVTTTAGVAALVAVPLALAGRVVGSRLASRLDEKVFRRVVLALLAASGVAAILAA
jgi:uncharacterized protein